MNLMGLFRSPQNELEKGGKQPKNPQEESHEITMTCPKCGTQTPVSELWDTQNVCRCGHHFRMTARQRISFLADEDSFTELDGDMTSRDILDFPNYENKLKSARLATREKEAVICGTLRVEDEPCAVFCMDPHFMMGSMGTVVGEKITRLFEYATEHRLPVIGFTAAGGARMQEGILSLMQMAKTSGAVRLHSDAGLFYLTVLTDPTTGGRTVTVIAIEKGGDTRDKVYRNFGSPNPEGYRKALRLMRQAEKFHRPVVCFVDTSGAFCGIGAEERGQGQAIAENLIEMMGLKTPVISVLIGEGGSGGALALAVADRVWILENAVYSVVSPEGCASILWKDAKRAKEAAECLRLTAQDMEQLGVVEQVISEEDKGAVFTRVKSMLETELDALCEKDTETLLKERYERFRKY